MNWSGFEPPTYCVYGAWCNYLTAGPEGSTTWCKAIKLKVKVTFDLPDSKVICSPVSQSARRAVLSHEAVMTCDPKGIQSAAVRTSVWRDSSIWGEASTVELCGKSGISPGGGQRVKKEKKELCLTIFFFLKLICIKLLFFLY